MLDTGIKYDYFKNYQQLRTTQYHSVSSVTNVYSASLIKTHFLFILLTPKTLTRTVSTLLIYKVPKCISVIDREERLPGFSVPLPGWPFKPHRNFFRIIMFIHNLYVSSRSSLYIFELPALPKLFPSFKRDFFLKGPIHPSLNFAVSLRKKNCTKN